MLSRLFYTAITLAPGAGATTQEAGAAVAPKDGATDAPQNGAEQADLSLSTIQDVRSFDDLQEAGTALVNVFQSYALLYIPKIVFAIIALVLGLFVVKILVALTGRAFKVLEGDKYARTTRPHGRLQRVRHASVLQPSIVSTHPDTKG